MGPFTASFRSFAVINWLSNNGQAMFSHNMRENLDGSVRFDDIALAVFQQLLRCSCFDL